jgi:hypothetical protein
MDESKVNPTRKEGRHLRVPVLPTEESEIKANANRAGLSIAEYLRRLGLGYEIRALFDQDCILQLSKINADLGRLGGLLKWWLIQDKRVAHFDANTVRTLLQKIKATQEALLAVVKRL